MASTTAESTKGSKVKVVIDAAATALVAASDLTLARFPLRAPDFETTAPSSWTIARPKDDASSPDSPLTLASSSRQGERFEGRPERGNMHKTAAYYFFLKSGDGTFRAIPVDRWYNFKPVVAPRGGSGEGAAPRDVEDAEREMRKREMLPVGLNRPTDFARRIQEGQEAARTLGAAARAARRQGATIQAKAGDAKAAASAPTQDQEDIIEVKDAEDETLRRKLSVTFNRSAARLNAGADPAQAQEDAADQNQPFGLGEDWEHEHSFDDDDERVEVDEADFAESGDAAIAEKKNTQVKEELEAKGMAAADEEKDPSASGRVKVESIEDIAKKQKEMQRALSKFGIREEGADADADEDFPGASDDLDYEKMAEEELKGVDLSHLGGTHGAAGEAKPKEAAKGSKPKPTTTTNPAAPASQSQKRKNRSESPIKAERSPSAASQPKKVKTEAKAAVAGVPSDLEIEEYLRRRGKMLSTELIAHFKKRLRSKEDSSRFLKAVKRVAKLESGQGKKKFVVLR